MKLGFCFATLILVSAAVAEPLTVCEALENRLELSGKSVRIRGIWGVGDAGQELDPVVDCARPLVQDGWAFQATICVVPDQSEMSVREYIAANLRLRDAHRATHGVGVIATLSGRLEGQPHFMTFHDAFGVELVRAFGGYAAAQMRFWKADHFEIHEYTAEEEKRGLEQARNFLPRRVQK